MTLFQAIVLGLVQGVAELLPISSSAHLALAPYFFGWTDPGLAFDVALHAGTLLALTSYFFKDWRDMFASAFRLVKQRSVVNDEDRQFLYLVVATIPAAVAGILLQDLAESTLRAPWIMGTTLIVMGVVLWAVDRWSPQSRAEREMRLRDAVLIGFAQVLSLVPGVSRSGSTMTAGRALSMDRKGAARFSFLMSMPITLAAVLLKAPDAVRESGLTIQLVAGVLTAFVSSLLVLSVLFRYISRHSFGVFAIYRVILGLVVFATIAARR